MSIRLQRGATVVIREIVELHAEEAAFLWTQRDKAVTAPNYTVRSLAALDERVEAHLDGLRVAQDAGWEICKAALPEGREGEIFVAAELAVESKAPDRIAEVLTFGCAKPAFERPLISALGWMPFEAAKPCLSRFIGDPDPRIRRVGIAGFAVHRQDPGPVLMEAIADRDSRLRARAIEAVAELGRRDLAGYIRSPDTYPDEYSRFAAAWTLARFGWPSPALKSIVEEGGPYAQRALHMAILTMVPAIAKEWCESSLMTRPETVRLGILGLGFVGTRECADALIPLMKDKQLARLAGHAFSHITGADLNSPPLEGKHPDEVGEQASDEPEEEVVNDPDGLLNWPALDQLETWWNNRRSNFRQRCILGMEITTSLLSEIVVNERQAFRSLAALELAAREQSRPMYEVRHREVSRREVVSREDRRPNAPRM